MGMTALREAVDAVMPEPAVEMSVDAGVSEQADQRSIVVPATPVASQSTQAALGELGVPPGTAGG
eukprot:11032986-Karenia_brevis.AAC.1